MVPGLLVFFLLITTLADVTIRMANQTNIHSNKVLVKQQGKPCPFPMWEMPCWLAEKNHVHDLHASVTRSPDPVVPGKAEFKHESADREMDC